MNDILNAINEYAPLLIVLTFGLWALWENFLKKIYLERVKGGYVDENTQKLIEQLEKQAARLVKLMEQKNPEWAGEEKFETVYNQLQDRFAIATIGGEKRLIEIIEAAVFDAKKGKE